MAGTVRCAVSAGAHAEAQRTLARPVFWLVESVAHTLRWATLTAQRAVPTIRVFRHSLRIEDNPRSVLRWAPRKKRAAVRRPPP